MRIGLIPEGLADRLKLRSRRLPLPLFDVMGTMLVSRAVMAGVHFGVFDRLGGGLKTAAELAREAGCDPHGLELLLDALAACDYLKREGDRYRNSRLGERWLVSDAPQSLADFVRYNYDQWEWVSHMEELVGRGAARNIHQHLDEKGWRRYMLGMRDLARLSADELVARLRFSPPPRRLLDAGGGHGRYTVAMCRRYPELRATIVDLEPATRTGRELVEQAGFLPQVEFRTGSLAEMDFERDYDVIFFFNVAHHLDEQTNRSLLRRFHHCLRARGTLVVWEPFRKDKRGRKDQLGSLLALFFGITSRERTYSFTEVAAWTEAAGFHRIRRKKLLTAAHASLLVAEKS